MRKIFAIVTAAMLGILTLSCVDVVKGTCLDYRCNGHCDWALHGVNEPYSYISYKGTGACPGDTVWTLEVYSPTNLVDGIVYRYDYVIENWEELK